MAVVEFERQGFESWLRSVKGCLMSDKSDEIKREVLKGFHITVMTLISDWSSKAGIFDPEEVMSAVYSINDAKSGWYGDFEQCVKNFCLYSEVACDMVCNVNPAMVSVLCSNGVFDEAMLNDIPYLELYFDSFSGLYKYCTSVSTSYFN